MNKTAIDIAFNQAIAYHQQGEIDEAQILYEDILRSDHNHHFALQFLGVIASQKGNHHYARRLLESSLYLNPSDSNALANLGQVYFYLGMYEKAIESCDESIALNKDNPLCHLTRGKSLRYLRRFEQAIDAFDEVVRLQASLVEGYAHRGFCWHNLGDFVKALDNYVQALRLSPENAEVLSHCAHALFSLDRYAEAFEGIDKALQVDPNYAEALYHRGLLLQHDSRLEEAVACYSRALQLNPNYPQALEHLAFVMHKMGRSDQECLALLDRSLLIQPHSVSALKARAGLLVRLKLLDEALADYDQIVALEPGDAVTHANRAETLLLCKRTAEAIAGFKAALALGGNEAELTYALASLGEDIAPTTAPTNYVVKLFDWYARHFDDHLQIQLEYRTPSLICQQILGLAPGVDLEVLDIGCGTGLCGPLLKPFSRRLTGVDLSPNMLEMAAKRLLYDELVCSDLVEFLSRHSDKFELVVAADVLLYVGALEHVFLAARTAMRLDGLFSFSFETSEADDLVLRPSRRYAHSVPYVQRLAAQHRFRIESMEASVIRKEAGQSMHGFIATLRAI